MDVPGNVVGVFRRHYQEARHEFPSRIREAQAFGANEDWPWNGFVLSFSTFGGSRNWEKRVSRRIHDFSWGRVTKLSDPDRIALFQTVPNPRFRVRVSKWIEAAYQKILAAGGPANIRNYYQSIGTADGRIAFFKGFSGIGNKYARNMPMDVYDPLVRDHFALDHRLKAILSQITDRKMSYQEGERFLSQLSGMLGIDGWTFDRLLYSRYDTILHDLVAARTNV